MSTEWGVARMGVGERVEAFSRGWIGRIEPRSLRRSLGQRGEAAAARYLWWRGYTIVERNCRSPAE